MFLKVTIVCSALATGDTPQLWTCNNGDQRILLQALLDCMLFLGCFQSYSICSIEQDLHFLRPFLLHISILQARMLESFHCTQIPCSNYYQSTCNLHVYTCRNQDIPIHSISNSTHLANVTPHFPVYRSSVSNCFRASAITFCKYNNSSTRPNFLGSFLNTILKSSTLSLCLGAAILAASIHYSSVLDDNPRPSHTFAQFRSKRAFK